RPRPSARSSGRSIGSPSSTTSPGSRRCTRSARTSARRPTRASWCSRSAPSRRSPSSSLPSPTRPDAPPRELTGPPPERWLTGYGRRDHVRQLSSDLPKVAHQVRPAGPGEPPFGEGSVGGGVAALGGRRGRRARAVVVVTSGGGAALGHLLAQHDLGG